MFTFKHLLLSIFFFLLLFQSSNLFALPEYFRKGYHTCVPCHISPSGGGLLTPYGRAIGGTDLPSRNFLSLTPPQEETSANTTVVQRVNRTIWTGNFAHGLVPLPQWLHLGGDVRWIQIRKEDAKKILARPILMQLDGEGAIDMGNLTFLVSVGVSPGGSLFSRKHYAILRVRESFLIRAGHFLPPFGLNIADHTAFTRSFAKLEERKAYGVETSLIGDSLTTQLALLRSPTAPILATLDMQKKIGESSKIGISLLGPAFRNRHKWAAALHGGVGLTRSLYLLYEGDVFLTGFAQKQACEFATLVDLGLEIFQGFHLRLRPEGAARLKKSLLGKRRREFLFAQNIYLQYFPLPHWEVLSGLKYEKRWQETERDSEITGLFQVHYYF